MKLSKYVKGYFVLKNSVFLDRLYKNKNKLLYYLFTLKSGKQTLVGGGLTGLNPDNTE
jgi:hypothetical protein